jgi:hypothetical protein
LLVRSPFLPHAVVRDAWSKLSGATIVDIRQVKKSWEAYTYVTKYLAKLRVLPWTTRHLAWSKKFFPTKVPMPRSHIDLDNKSRHLMHPAQVLDERYRGCSIQRLSRFLYEITGQLEESPL